MGQADYIKDIAKFGLENDQDNLLSTLSQLIEHSKKTKKINFALQLQSLLKESLRQHQVSGITSIGSSKHILREEDREINDFILEKVTSDYGFDNLICSETTREELKYFVEEHRQIDVLRSFQLPVGNKILLYGPTGCGKTLASYVIAGELNKMMYVINLGAIVSSKLGETSKNLAKIFRKAAAEDSIIFIDEFDSLGKVRDYSQDHGEMKRVVNTILQLFDYLSQTSVVIAATNQKDMLDSALVRRFDVTLELNLPTTNQIEDLINLTLRNGVFSFDKTSSLKSIIRDCRGLSFYSIQKTLITAIKRSLITTSGGEIADGKPVINTKLWKNLIASEKQALNVEEESES